MLPPGSSKAAVAALGLSVEKILAPSGKPVVKILHHLDRRPADLIVLATHQRSGRARWMYEAVAEPVARASHAMTLFVPPATSGFVGYENGQISLQRILIPVDRVPAPASALRAAAALCECLGLAHVAFTVLHVGSRKSVPKVDPPVREGARWRLLAREGDVVEEILRAVEENGVELVIMATQGHKGFIDALRGSTTERIVRSATCPVLAVPVAST
jgi:nucleotide-binding universal stress UspA family protein